MTERLRRQIGITRLLPRPNQYTLSLEGELSHRAFSEERAPLNKSIWRNQVFGVDRSHSLDLEIGTGNGHHFTHRALNFPERCIVGIELKYKPLVQTIRRTLKAGAMNAAICRFHALDVDLLFDNEELNNIYVHFPDPWTSPKKPKNRIMQSHLLKQLFQLQRSQSFLEFKTDSREMFLWALDEIKSSPYEIMHHTFDLHHSEYQADNFVTFFESIFIRQQIPINYLRLYRP